MAPGYDFGSTLPVRNPVTEVTLLSIISAVQFDTDVGDAVLGNVSPHPCFNGCGNLSGVSLVGSSPWIRETRSAAGASNKRVHGKGRGAQEKSSGQASRI